MTLDQTRYRALVRGEIRGLGPSLARLGLRLLALPYSLATWARNLAYDRGWKTVFHAGIPVISVGNLTVGGTGKTPTVELLADWLRRWGVRVVILSRGYGAEEGPNDEALVLEENLPDVPHLQGADRVALAQIACEELASEVVLLDDGFQHRRLHRDLDVVLLDATDPFGGGRQLPAGLLRESVRALRRADLVLLTRCNAVGAARREEIHRRVAQVVGAVPWGEVCFVPSRLQRHEGREQPISWLAGRHVLAFCGLGNPSAFWQTLGDAGAEVIDQRPFPDHHRYTRQDVLELTQWARDRCPEAVITTQKDLVKLRLGELAGVPLYAVRIVARVDSGTQELEQALRRTCPALAK